MTGHVGEVRHGYFVAASLARWSFTGSSKGGQFSATVAEAHPFRLSQAPLRIVLPVGSTVYRWPVVSLQLEGHALTAELGEKE